MGVGARRSADSPRVFWAPEPGIVAQIERTYYSVTSSSTMLTYKSKPLRVPTSSLSFFRITWFAEFFSLLLRMSEGREGSSQRPKVGKARAHSLLSLLPSGLHSCHGFSEALGLLTVGPLSLCQPTNSPTTWTRCTCP